MNWSSLRESDNIVATGESSSRDHRRMGLRGGGYLVFTRYQLLAIRHPPSAIGVSAAELALTLAFDLRPHGEHEVAEEEGKISAGN